MYDLQDLVLPMATVPYHLSPWSSMERGAASLWLMEERLPSDVRALILLISDALELGERSGAICERLVIEGSRGEMASLVRRSFHANLRRSGDVLWIGDVLGSILPPRHTSPILMDVSFRMIMEESELLYSEVDEYGMSYAESNYVGNSFVNDRSGAEPRCPRSLTESGVTKLLTYLESLDFPHMSLDADEGSALPLDFYLDNSAVAISRHLKEEEMKLLLLGRKYLRSLSLDEELRLSHAHEHFTPSRIMEFGALIEEYNVEWARCSMDWSGGRESQVRFAMTEVLKQGGHLG